MNMNDIYVLELPSTLNLKWYDAARASATMPRAVEALLGGDQYVIVRGRELDAINDWDCMIARQTATSSQLESYPVGLNSPILAKKARS